MSDVFLRDVTAASSAADSDRLYIEQGTLAVSDVARRATVGQVRAGLQPADAGLTSLAGLTWTAGRRVVEMTAADTFTLQVVGASAPDGIIDRVAGDLRYAQLAVNNTFTGNLLELAPPSGGALLAISAVTGGEGILEYKQGGVLRFRQFISSATGRIIWRAYDTAGVFTGDPMILDQAAARILFPLAPRNTSAGTDDAVGRDDVNALILAPGGVGNVAKSFNSTTGEITLTIPAGGVGTTQIADEAVTFAKMANVATNTLLGRATAGTGDVEALTAAQATALLDNFTTSLKGTVPGSGGGTTNFLRADGTWAAPPGGGGSPGGSSGQVQWNSASAFAGASGLTINGTGEPVLPRFLDVSEMTAPAAPAADTIRLYAEDMAGQSALMLARATGEPCQVQYGIGGRRFGWALPSTGTALNSTGSVTASGTLAHPAIASTTLLTYMRRGTFTPSAAVNAVAGFRNGEGQLLRGSVARKGGFEFWLRFATVATNTECAAFFGIASSLSTNLSDPDPGANRQDAFGIARRGGAPGETNWQFVRRAGTGTAVYQDLGVVFNTSGGDVWDLHIYLAPNSSTFGVRCLFRPNDWSLPSVALHTTYSSSVPNADEPLSYQGFLRAGGTSFQPICALLHAVWSSDT
jgi:hypothetical protein